MHQPPRSTLAALALAAAATVTAALYRRKARALSEAEFDALIANLHTHLSTDVVASPEFGAAGGFIYLGEDPPVGEGPWFWHVAAVGGEDESGKYGMRALRHLSGWAGTRASANAAYHQAMHELTYQPTAPDGTAGVAVE